MISSHDFLLFQFSRLSFRNFILPIVLYLGVMFFLLLWSTHAYAVVFLGLILNRCLRVNYGQECWSFRSPPR